MIREKINNYRAEKQARADDAQADYDATHADLELHRPLDTLRTDATEILGDNSGLIRGHYRRVADSIDQKIAVAENKKDVKGTREKYLEFRANQSTIKIARIQAKIDGSSDSFLSRQINNQRKQSIAALNRKKKVLAHQSGSLEKNRRHKPEQLQKKIDEHIKKRVDAMYRKAIRQEMRKQGVGKHNVVKRTEFLAKLTPDVRKKISREAILLVRKRNIETGQLDADYDVGTTLETRKVDHYERTIE